MNYEAKQAAIAAQAAILVALNPKLLQVNPQRDGLVTAAKNMRIELAAAFPGVKFSIKSRRFSGGDAIDVRWTDGPCTEQVDAIIDKYAAGSFSGMDDSYTYSSSAWNRAFGDAKYVGSDRRYSDAAVASALRTVASKYASNLRDAGVTLPTAAEYQSGRFSWSYAKVLGNDDARDLVSATLYRRTWALTKQVIARWPDMASVDEVAA